jgi:hypothetical protein
MRYLTALTTSSAASQVERGIGSGRLRALRPDETPDHLGGERFAAIIADGGARVASVRYGVPVILVAPMHRAGLQQFRAIAEAGVDVRMATDCGATLSETTLRCVSAPRAPSPAAAIVHFLRDRYTGMAPDVITAAAILGNARRSMEEIARVCDSSPAGIRQALRENQLVAISGLLARMRCLHALWAWQSDRPNFWSAAGFRTLAELSAHLSQHTGAPLGRWKVPGGFSALLQSVGNDLAASDLREVAAV